MNASKKMLVSSLALALGLLALAAPAAAESGSYGYFRVVEGSATLLQAGTDERTSAEINQPVLAGDRISVPERSRVEIVLADRNLLRLDGGSELVLERLAASPDRDDRATVLRLLEGNLQLVVLQDSLGDELPRVETPNATVYPQNYGVYRITADRAGFSEVVVRRGTAEVVTDRGTERVRADEEAIVDGDRYAEVQVREAAGFDTLERWARQMDDEYASTDQPYVDDNLRYQAAPLARYGSWVTVDGSPYWRPRVAAGWRPFYDGRWIYTPAGMTWVSYEPWGWVPYHYGSWDYLAAYGWVWQPGYVWSPAWVYWYWGPSYVGWCPTGYYTRFYGPHFGFNFGFRSGLYGWAGGDWGHFNHWSFVRTSYFDGYRNGYRDGFWDGRHGHDVRRYAVPIDGSTVRGALERGVITTDTKPLRPSTWANHNEVLRALRADRNGARGAELPDVTSFIARKPDLPATVARTVRAEGNTNSLDGTPLKPSTLGRGGRRAETGGAAPGNHADWANRVGSKPRIVLGDDGPSAGAVGSRPSTRENPQARSGRPAPEADGGSPRPRGSFEKPNRPEASEPSRRDEPAVREREPTARPTPEADGGAPRPQRVEIDSKPGSRTPERESSPPPRDNARSARPPAEERRPPVDRQQIQREIELRRQSEQRRQEVYVRPQTTDRYVQPDRRERPEPSVQSDRYRQPEPRVIQPTYRGPEPSRRSPDPPRYEQRQPAPTSRPDSSATRQAPPPRSRGNEQGSRPPARQTRPRDDGGRERH